MPKRLYAAAQTGFPVRVSPGAGSRRCTDKTTRIAGVPLRTGKTGCRAADDGSCTNETTRGGIAGVKTTCGDFAGDCKNKIACPAVRSYSRA
jgi:hypothetical protein